jgi:hypothetical protein
MGLLTHGLAMQHHINRDRREGKHNENRPKQNPSNPEGAKINSVLN